MSVLADGLRSLQQVVELVEIGIGIRIIHQLIEEIKCRPDRHFLLIKRKVLLLLFPHEIVGMVQTIELADGIATGFFVFAVFSGSLCGGDGFGFGIYFKVSARPIPYCSSQLTH